MNYFQDIALFQDISPEDQVNLSDFCQMQILPAWEILFSEGNAPTALYIIKEGELQVYKDIKGNRKNIARLGFWDLVGEMAFFWEPPLRSATVSALRDTRLIVLLHYSLTQMLQKYPLLHDTIKALIEHRIQQNIEK
jgi:CRP/FNR family transcriptional regulator, cyclic AMP receptor protein